MRYSRAFIKTKKKEKLVNSNELISLILMERAFMIRKIASGIYEWLPFGLKVLKNVENIIRKEMNKVGYQEVFLPAIQPKEFWEKSERWGIYGKELVRIKDRNNRDFCLGPTHEEVITELIAGEINSYRDLPIILYQFQTKFRDEIRPRFGVMRSREFLMKDAYSFDKTDEDAKKSYEVIKEVYKNIFTELGLKFVICEADSGAIGGKYSHEFMILASSGESEIVSSKCSYAANTEKAEFYIDENIEKEDEKILEKIETKNIKIISNVAKFLDISKKKIIKSLIYFVDEKFIMFLIRGDREINEFKIINYFSAKEIRLATDEEILNLNFKLGYIGPKDVKNIDIYADLQIKNLKNVVIGANEENFHYKNVNIFRDFDVKEFFDFSFVEEGDLCPNCREKLKFSRGIEVGHIFKLGTKYSKAFNAKYLDLDGKKKIMFMGCYGIGVSRVVAASIEQNHDENGIIWPFNLAPYKIGIICLDVKNQELFSLAENCYKNINKIYETLFDDRDERIGVKFNDFELLGIPIVLIFGKKYFLDKKVEIKIRKTGEKFFKEIEEILSFLDNIKNNL